MIRSMTGFGKGTAKSPYGAITAEVKTLNHKCLSVSCASLNGFFTLEERIKTLFEGKVHRGKVYVKITIEGGSRKKPLQQVELNEAVAREYMKKINRARKRLGVGGDIDIRDLLSFPGVIEAKPEKNEEKVWPHVKKALLAAIGRLADYRRKEGARLAKDFIARLDNIKKDMRQIKKYGKQSVAAYRKKLVQSVKELAENAELDKGRLETEVALFAKNCDIAEEITRLEGHIVAYRDAMNKARADVGKKLDFIAQEMQREINTIGAKSGDFRISKAVIEIKSEIEKMREQTKNIE